ncbi:MAG TPA: hypothetical protein VKI20_09390, partial [Acidimicrobiales bacterium]|nr:hypothetical protein [Acidimicrobiales bacterium]
RYQEQLGQDEAEADAMASGAFQQLLETGMDPMAVADQVLDAVREERFWILTHPEADPAIRTRAEDILERRNPTAQFFMA